MGMDGIERSITHWTAGGGRASSTDKKHYHRITEADGTIVQGTEEIADNVVVTDGDYAAHVRNLNTGSAGFAMAGMHGAQEFPFDPGPVPINRKQFEAHCRMLAEFHVAYGIPVTNRTCITHAEVEPTLGVKQLGKWDFTRIPFEPGIVGAIPCGDYLRERVRAYLPKNWIETNRPLLRQGDRGMFVQDLQVMLNEASYFVGKTDGIFGSKTDTQVRAFQRDNGLHVDGIVGPDTWTALRDPEPVPARDVTEDDLRRDGSETIKIADEGETKTKQGAAAVVGLGTLDTGLEAADKLREAEGTLAAVQGVLADNWPVILLIAVGVVVYLYGPKLMKRLRYVRTRDARMGANMRR